MGEKRSETYDQDIKDQQNEEILQEHRDRRERLGQQAQEEETDERKVPEETPTEEK